LFEAACGLGSGAACGRLGELVRDGRGVAPDDRRARSLFEQGCALGSTAACDAVGH
jgi:TPR repeat protein